MAMPTVRANDEVAWDVVPYLTAWQSEFVYVRLEYVHGQRIPYQTPDGGLGRRTDNRVLLQIDFATALLAASPAQSAPKKLKVVVTSSAYQPIAEYIGGDKVEVAHIIAGNQDPHIVRPKPSLAVLLKQADVYVATGMDLEMWSPALVEPDLALLDRGRGKPRRPGCAASPVR